MIFLWLPLGFVIPTLCGWTLLRLLEGRHPVLFALERWVMGFLLGTTLTMYLTVMAQIAGLISFTKIGFLTVQIALLLLLEGLFLWKRKTIAAPSPRPQPIPSLTGWKKIGFIVIGVWIAIKVVTGILLLTTTPVYFDDVFNNWNMRGKIFFETKELTLVMEAGNEILSVGGVGSYPPTVPLLKTWFATLAGRWHDGLVSAPHILWYLAATLLVYFFLRRQSSFWIACLGVYVLASIPLYLIHGSTPYADVFLSVHVFIALTFPFSAVSAKTREHRLAFYRLGAVAAAMLIFTKNEALVLHLPPILLVTGLALLWNLQRRELSLRDTLGIGARYGIAVGLVAIPWIWFKWMHNLPFGNAKDIPLSDFSWQEGVLYSISINTFFEGNWIFLFPFLLALFVFSRQRAWRTPAVMFTVFLLIVYGMQLPIYLFTGISTEALQQTGYARGLIHLVPISVVLMVMLLEDLLRRKRLIA
ncbi:hypothetical protein HYZ99_01730 [Candidatus Peregrinibacteria bacterium]|nr:hypothetical protein [Candidatus Peregrinibacteria bacterium]